MKNVKPFLTAGLFSLAVAIAGLAFAPSTALAQAAQKYNDEGKDRSLCPDASGSRGTHARAGTGQKG